MRLVWTDIASNYFTSSRGNNNPSILPQQYSRKPVAVAEAEVPVFRAERRIHYHWPYAIPALIMVGIILLVIPCALFVAFTGALRDLK
jgi:hypothetical protein